MTLYKVTALSMSNVSSRIYEQCALEDLALVLLDTRRLRTMELGKLDARHTIGCWTFAHSWVLDACDAHGQQGQR